MNDQSWQYRSRPGALQWMFPPFRGAVKILILSCGVVFLGQIVLQAAGFGGIQSLESWNPAKLDFLHVFGLVPLEVLTGFRIWQPFTYLFLHGGFSHLLFNMLALWMFGSALEMEWGMRRFLFYYFLTGVGGALTVILFSPFSLSVTIGASGAVLGLLLAFGVLHPNQPIFIYGIFPVKAKWMVLATGVLTVWGSWAGMGGGVSYLAHLGGMAFGFAYLKRIWRVGELYREIRWRLRRRRFHVIRRDRGNGDPRFPFH